MFPFTNLFERFKFLSISLRDSGYFLCFFWNFTRENGAQAAKIDLLTHALRLTAVLKVIYVRLRSSHKYIF